MQFHLLTQIYVHIWRDGEKVKVQIKSQTGCFAWKQDQESLTFHLLASYQQRLFYSVLTIKIFPLFNIQNALKLIFLISHSVFNSAN